MNQWDAAARSADAGLEPLLGPIRIGDCLVPNRLMMSALTLQFGEGGAASDLHAAFYRERAEGGVGLILSEQLNATSICTSPFPTALHADNVECARSLRKVVDALEQTKTKFFAQLFASGACGAPTSLANFAPLRAPSSIGIPGGQTPLPLAREEIAQIVRDFAASAANAKAAGCHGVEIHGAHGWLIGEFLSPYYNRRADDYGGPIENRCRFAIEIGRAVREAVGPGFPVGISLSYDEMIGDAGITPSDTLAQVDELSKACLYDFFDFSIGSVHSEHFTIAPMDVEEGFALDFASQARRQLGGRAVVMVSGRVVDIDQAANAIASGQADLVAMSRAHIADPHILRKALDGERHLIRRCIGDNACLQNALSGEKVKCLVNPRGGRELEVPERVVGASARKRVVVIGAGPAGLAFSQRAAMAGHEVTLHEKDTHPGGHVRIRSMLPHREVWNNVIDDLVAAFRHASGELLLESAQTRAQIEALDCDLVVLATGAEWHDSRWQDGDRVESVRVVTFDAAVVETDGLGSHVLIVDETGSYEPLGLAEKALLSGKRVTFVTSRSSPGELTRPTMEYAHVIPRLRALGIRIFSEAQLGQIRERSVGVVDIWGNHVMNIRDVTSLVSTTMRLPRTSDFPSPGSAANLKVIGDALVPRETSVVLHDAFFEAARL